MSLFDDIGDAISFHGFIELIIALIILSAGIFIKAPKRSEVLNDGDTIIDTIITEDNEVIELHVDDDTLRIYLDIYNDDKKPVE